MDRRGPYWDLLCHADKPGRVFLFVFLLVLPFNRLEGDAGHRWRSLMWRKWRRIRRLEDDFSSMDPGSYAVENRVRELRPDDVGVKIRQLCEPRAEDLLVQKLIDVRTILGIRPEKEILKFSDVV